MLGVFAQHNGCCFQDQANIYICAEKQPSSITSKNDSVTLFFGYFSTHYITRRGLARKILLIKARSVIITLRPFFSAFTTSQLQTESGKLSRLFGGSKSPQWTMDNNNESLRDR